MSEMMECPICGNKYDIYNFTIGENGNPVCINCAQEEEEKDSE